jgi:hypothetical protein
MRRSAYAGVVYAIQQHGEGGPVEDYGALPSALLLGRLEPAALEAFVPEHEAAVVPGEHFDPVSATRHEGEQVAAIHIEAHLVDEEPQLVEPRPHIHRRGGQKDPDAAREQEHQAPKPSAAAKYSGGGSTANVTVTPVAV